MLKLIKYEFRKSRNTFLIVLCILAALEVYFLGSIALKKETHVVVSMSLLFFGGLGAAMAVYITGIFSYSNELKQRSSYLIFMTPNSPLTIIASKMLYTLFIGLLCGAVLGALVYVDVPLMLNYFGQWRGYYDLIDQIMLEQGVNLTQIFLFAGFMLLMVLLELLSTVCVAYLSVTLASTFLQNKKAKGVVSFLLFALIAYGLVRLGELYLNDTQAFETISQMLHALLPVLIQDIVVILACLFGSAWMLDKRVSL